MTTVSNETWLAGRVQLPVDCEAEYFPTFLTPQESTEIFDHLCANYDVKDRRLPTIDGREIERDVGKYVFADPELTDYAHLHETLGQRAPWPPLLEMVKERLESVFDRPFNVCLCIYYRSGEAGAGFHRDMPDFGSVSFITVISLGAEREFVFRRHDDHSDEYRLVLKSGSLLTMGEHCQERYEHGIPFDPTCTSPRISLSYRPYGSP